MRILHTSDWHLGRSFGAVSLADDQQAFITWMTAEAMSRKVDLVVIAGDIFDRAIAPTEAVVMFRNALRNLQAASITVAVITGNHDGADRVFAYDDLLDLSGVYIRGGYSKIGEVITLNFADGPLDLVMLPFLDPQAAPDGLSEATGEETADASDRRRARTHQSVLAAAIAEALPSLSAPRSLAVSHAYVAGATVSDSERQLTIGGTGTVDASLFDKFSYTALGHLHRPQTVGSRPTVRYSGTPLAYSFSEDHAKSIEIIDMAADGTCVVEPVAIPVGRPVLTVTGLIDELLLAEPSPEAKRSLVRAFITDPGVVLDAKQRLSAIYPHVVEIVLSPPIISGDDGETPLDRNTVTPSEAATLFWIDSTGDEPSAEQLEVLHAAIAKAIADAELKAV